MMTPCHALVVEDDDRIVDMIADTLYSLGHQFEWAGSQSEAQQKLSNREFDYILLDLQIPARTGGGGANVEFGLHLLKTVRQSAGAAKLPVVVMTAHSSACVDLMSELKRYDPNDFISKPFPERGRTLAAVIRKVLETSVDSAIMGKTAPHATTDGDGRFVGGELVLFPDRAELCGVRIVTDRGAGQCLMVLRELAKRDDAGRYVRRSAEELAAAIQALGGTGTITGCIKRIRDNAAKRLAKERGVECARDDVVQNNEQGYSLREWIVA